VTGTETDWVAETEQGAGMQVDACGGPLCLVCRGPAAPQAHPRRRVPFPADADAGSRAPAAASAAAVGADSAGAAMAAGTPKWLLKPVEAVVAAADAGAAAAAEAAAGEVVDFHELFCCGECLRNYTLRTRSGPVPMGEPPALASSLVDRQSPRTAGIFLSLLRGLEICAEGTSDQLRRTLGCRPNVRNTSVRGAGDGAGAT
jgi:hypothetical protein